MRGWRRIDVAWSSPNSLVHEAASGKGLSPQAPKPMEALPLNSVCFFGQLLHTQHVKQSWCCWRSFSCSIPLGYGHPSFESWPLAFLTRKVLFSLQFVLLCSGCVGAGLHHPTWGSGAAHLSIRVPSVLAGKGKLSEPQMDTFQP